MSARAGIVVTGTEVLTGRVQDRNGPWVADRLLELGIELAHITICGDRPADMQAQLQFMADQGVDLIITSGGLGPTADDLTAEEVGRFQGREMVLDEALEQRIADILRPLMRRWRNLDFDAVRAANRKQAIIPAGSFVIDPAGTAPGLVVPPAEGRDGPTIVVMPGPPRELHEMWPVAVASDEFAAATAGRTDYEQRMLRLFGIPESEIAETLRVAEPAVEGFEHMEITTCLRRGELEVVVRYEPATKPAYEALEGVIRERHSQYLYSTDGSSIDEQVSELLGDMQIAVGESCTGGLMTARLTARPGSSGCVQGGVVAYSDEAKAHLLGIKPALIEAHGAVSPEVAEALADGAIARFDAQVGVGITGIAGPDGGTKEKPVGYVCWCVKLDDGRKLARDVCLPGNRNEIRDRATTVAMHLLRRLLSGEELPLLTKQRLGSPRARLFVALDLPPDIRAHLAEWRDGLLAGRDDLRPVTEGALHVTLAFLGYRPEQEAAAIAEAMESAGGDAPLLEAREVVPVPPRQPRLFALDLDDPDGACVRLQQAVSDALETGRFYKPEKRPFWPHVTLARVKRNQRAGPLPGEPPPLEPFRAPQLTLYRSTLRPQGAKYDALATTELT